MSTLEPRATIDHANDESIILIDGKPVGLPVRDNEASIICRWLNSAMVDVEFKWKPTSPVVKEEMLADLIHRGITGKVGAFRTIMIDALTAIGPVWHTFRCECWCTKDLVKEGERRLLYIIDRKVFTYLDGHVPSWIPRHKRWEESTDIPLMEAIRNRINSIATGSSNYRSNIRPTTNRLSPPVRKPIHSSQAVHPPWE